MNKRWRDVICLNRAQELGYKGVDLIQANEHIQYLWKGILFFQQHDKRTGFGNLQLPRSNMNALPLFPRFPPNIDLEKRQFVYPHPHSLLLTACKNMNVHEICTWFLTNTHYYAGEQTPWIDFFEQESAWSAVPNSAAIPETHPRERT